MNGEFLGIPIWSGWIGFDWATIAFILVMIPVFIYFNYSEKRRTIKAFRQIRQEKNLDEFLKTHPTSVRKAKKLNINPHTC